MRDKNVFHKLQEENELEYAEVHNEIKKNVKGRIGIWAFIGDIVDLYIPKIFSVLIGGRSANRMLGLSAGEETQADDKNG